MGIENYLPKCMAVTREQAARLEEIRVRTNKPVEYIMDNSATLGSRGSRKS